MGDRPEVVRIGAPTGPVTYVMSVGGVPAETTVAIYDVLGRRVRTVAAGRFTNPAQRVRWDGRDDGGTVVASGIYFVRVSGSGTKQTQKLVIVR